MLGSASRVILFTIIAFCIVGGVFAGRFKYTYSIAGGTGRTAGPRYGVNNSPSRNGWDAMRPRKISTPAECARTCREDEPPKTCLYTFTVEFWATLMNACTYCSSNATMPPDGACQCVTGDGFELSGIMTVNRMYPGPSIIVCENDLVVVDVVNHVPGNALTIHWHGITQRGTPYSDGVPFVTQCPIQEGSTFRYQWWARNTGTHFWHAHSGFHKAMGMEGAIIIREPKYMEPYHTIWNTEETSHTIFITDWLHDAPEAHFPGTLRNKPGQSPDNFLINGRGRWRNPVTGITTDSPWSVFTVKPGRRYRFRMINSCTFTCPVTMTIQGHDLTVFSIDGEPVKPVVVNSITSFSAERYDFVVNANRGYGSFWIQVRGIGGCASREMQQLAILRYESNGNFDQIISEAPTYAVGLNRGIVLNELNVRCDHLTQVPNVICVTQLKSVEQVPPRILKKHPDIQIYMPFGFFAHPPGEAYKFGQSKKFIVNIGREFSSVVNNISNVLPPSTLLTQRHDNPKGQICSPANLPESCATSKPCYCTHVIDCPLNSVVELILVDDTQATGLSHPFHLHGAAFYILGEGCGTDYNISSINVRLTKDLDRRGKLFRQMERPPAKDTFALPNNGFSIIRFIADNPGYWLFHCHFLPHIIDGMSAIFHVGEPEDLPPVPDGFPRCGNFIPNIL